MERSGREADPDGFAVGENRPAIAVYNVTPSFRWNLANELKDIAFLKRDKKMDMKPSRVEVIRHDSGLATLVYLFGVPLCP
jgi:hypothetical protein